MEVSIEPQCAAPLGSFTKKTTDRNNELNKEIYMLNRAATIVEDATQSWTLLNADVEANVPRFKICGEQIVF